MMLHVTHHVLYMLWCLETYYVRVMLHKCENMLQKICKIVQYCFGMSCFGYVLFQSIAAITGLLQIPFVPALIVSSILTVIIIVVLSSCMCYKPRKEECNPKSEMVRSEDVSFKEPNTFIHLTPEVDARVMIIFYIYLGKYMDIKLHLMNVIDELLSNFFRNRS